MDRGTGAPPTGLRHRGALVGSAAAVVDVAAAALADGLAAGDLPVLAAPPDTVDAVRRALGGDAGAVEDDPVLCLLGARAPDAATAVRRLLARVAGSASGRLLVVAVPQYGDDPRRWREVRRWEAAGTVLCAAAPMTVLCVHDRTRLPPEGLRTARTTHSELLAGGRPVPNPAYRPPGDCLRELAAVSEPVEDGPPVLAVDDVPTLVALRAGLRRVLTAAVPDPERSADLHLAASEVAANAFRHGRPPVSARVWADATSVVCAVSDSGPGLDDPLAGFLPAHGDDLGAGGMGLWLARRLWDSVDLLRSPSGGLTVRLATSLGTTPPGTAAGRGAA